MGEQMKESLYVMGYTNNPDENGEKNPDDFWTFEKEEDAAKDVSDQYMAFKRINEESLQKVIKGEFA